MIDIGSEVLIPFSGAPNWSEKNLPKRFSPSTFQRWRLRGCRGVTLDTIMIGGARWTSEQALSRFFSAVTSAADESVSSPPPDGSREKSAREAQQALEKDGI